MSINNDINLIDGRFIFKTVLIRTVIQTFKNIGYVIILIGCRNTKARLS